MEDTKKAQYDKNITIYEKGKEIFKGFYSNRTMFLYDDNEEPYTKNIIRVSVVVDGEYDWSGFNFSLKTVTDIVYGLPHTHKGNWMFFALITFFIVSTLIDIAFPLLFFKLKYMFDVRDPEPSDWYLAIQRFSWIAFPIVYVILYIIGLTMTA